MVLLVLAGVYYFGGQNNGIATGQNDNSLQNMPPRNYPNIQAPAAGSTAVPGGQIVAQNTIKLAIGVTLGGKGTVMSVDPGSPAQAAGLQVGDVINRINGR